ncbi:unnamed protein product [Lactuca virosa]|uniref:Uncharacterized protein n=1 Tax=Lactuca virosa TaxID=75947 RepID=A0AAU9M5W2_9ASTR|nr:unnamed protein product [Lactuca virosa]
MGKRLVRARARSEKLVVKDFIDLGFLPENESKVSSFSNADIDLLRLSSKFPQVPQFDKKNSSQEAIEGKTRSIALLGSSFNMDGLLSSDPVVKVEKSTTVGARKMEIKAKSPDPMKRKFTLEATTLVLKRAEELKKELEATKKKYELDMNRNDNELVSKDQLDDIDNKAKTFTIVSVLEARLRMVEDVEKNRVNSWDKTKWEHAMKKFNGEEQVGEKVGEENIKD